MNYDEFLRATAQMPEGEFYEIANSLPEISADEFEESLQDGTYYDLDSQYDLACIIINAILMRHTEHAYIDDLNLESKYIHIDDIESVEELRDVKSEFSQTGWIIGSDNEEEIEEAKRIEAEESARDKCLRVINNLPTETLEEIVSKL